MIQRLRDAVAERDREAVLCRLLPFVYESTTTRAHPLAELAMDSVMQAIEAFPLDGGVVGRGMCALVHVGKDSCDDVAMPVDRVLDVLRTYEATARNQADPPSRADATLVVQTALRLLDHHVCSPHVMDALPRLSEATARWLQRYDDDPVVAFYGGLILIKVASQEARDVRGTHGRAGVDARDVAVVAGATAAKHVDVCVRGQPWNAYVLDTLFPRLRGGA